MESVQKLELPKGGGAIKGIGESFEANFFTGSGSFSIPIPLPACRNLKPSLSIDYSSGSGNGPFSWKHHHNHRQLKSNRSEYEYDSLYRLTKATGREHVGINAKDSIIALPHINDQNGITNYTEFYDFDNAGNITETRHIGKQSFTDKFYVSNKSNRSLPKQHGTTINAGQNFL